VCLQPSGALIPGLIERAIEELIDGAPPLGVSGRGFHAAAQLGRLNGRLHLAEQIGGDLGDAMNLGGMPGHDLQELLLIVGLGDKLAALHQVTAAQLFGHGASWGWKGV
jgi:hypothetical protein